MNKIILLDTNFLLIPLRYKIDIFTLFKEKYYSFQLCILPETFKELKEISKFDDKLGRMAKATLKLLELKNIKIFDYKNKKIINLPKYHIETKFKSDEVFKKLKNHIIATLDKDLIKQIKKNNKVITLNNNILKEVN